MGNHIDHLEITNFKSIRHQKIEGCKRINVFIGYPNVGKSAILEAISSLSYLQRDFNEPFSKLCRLKNITELFYDGNIREIASIKYTENIKTEFQYLSENEIDYQIQELVFDINIVGDNNRYWVPLKMLRFTKNSIQQTQLNLRKDLLKVKKYLFQNAFNEHKTDGINFSFPNGENLVDIVQFNKELRKEVSELFKFYNLKLLIDQATNSIRGLKEIDEETIFTIPFYQMADTLQRLIFHKAAIISNENTVLLFEEPEAHMFPPYISKFTGDIIHEKKNGNQYFISTHSPFVLNDFLEDARDELSLYVVGLKGGETIIKRLTNEQMHEIYQFGVDLFFNIEDYIK